MESDDKEAIAKMTNQQLTNYLKQVASCDAIIAARKTTKQTIKVCCETDDYANELHNASWSSYILGLTVIKPSYSIVVHGVSKLDVNPEKEDTIVEVKKEIEISNLEKFSINKITSLQKRQRNPDAPTQSIIIQFNSPEEANDCIANGIFIGHKLYHTVRYMPQYRLKQCYKCYGFGHIAEECTRKMLCGRCGQEHPTIECKADKPMCLSTLQQ